MNVSVESGLHLQFQRLSDAALRVGRPFSSFIGPGIPLMRAQNDLRRAASFSVFGCGAGAFRLLPVAALYLARPLAVRPAPCDTGSFSPLDTDRLTCFLAIELSYLATHPVFPDPLSLTYNVVSDPPLTFKKRLPGVAVTTPSGLPDPAVIVAEDVIAEL